MNGSSESTSSAVSILSKSETQLEVGFYQLPNPFGER